MDFHKGQKVVCIKDTNQAIDGTKYVFRGQVYVVRTYGPYHWPQPEIGTRICIWLEGIRRDAGPLWPGYNDVPFELNRFRYLDERKTDISVFTKMLEPKQSELTSKV